MLHFFSRADLETRPKGLEWEGDETDRAEVHEKIRCNGCEVRPGPLRANDERASRQCWCRDRLGPSWEIATSA